MVNLKLKIKIFEHLYPLHTLFIPLFFKLQSLIENFFIFYLSIKNVTKEKELTCFVNVAYVYITVCL